MSKPFQGTVKTLVNCLFLLTVFLSVSACRTGYTAWEKNAVYRDIRFERVRYAMEDQQITGITGYIAEDIVIDGYACKAGMIKFFPDWTLKQFRASEMISILGIEMPADTWITFKVDGGLICVFPKNYFYQGFICRGGGGSTGVETVFYPSGALEYFYSPYDIIIDDIPCIGSNLTVIGLHENGSLKNCTLSENKIIGDREYKKREELCFSVNGEVIDCDF